MNSSRRDQQLPKILTAEQFRTLHSGRKLVARKRRTPGEMNPTEERYYNFLGERMLTGEIIEYGFGCMTFRISPTCVYKADFHLITREGGLELHDVKGTTRTKKTRKERPYTEEDALIKLKTVAERYQWLTVKRAWFSRDAGIWLTEDVV